jgi:predicted RNA-binding protein with PIN domain
MIPDIELKWVKNRIDDLALQKTITVILPQGTLRISNLELQIAFKEIMLKSPKDREDARHIQKVAEGYLDKKLLQKYKEMLSDFQ